MTPSALRTVLPVVILSLAACGSKEPDATKPELAAVHAAATKARDAYQKQIATWRTELRKLVTAKLPDTTAMCSHKIPGYGTKLVLRKAELGKLDSMVPKIYQRALKNLERIAKETGPESSLAKRLVSVYTRHVTEAVPSDKFHATLVVLDEKRPIRSNKSYSKGTIHGRILLWSVAKAAFVCGVELTVDTPDIAMQIRGAGQEGLMRSFESHVFFKAEYPSTKLRTLP